MADSRLFENRRLSISHDDAKWVSELKRLEFLNYYFFTSDALERHVLRYHEIAFVQTRQLWDCIHHSVWSIAYIIRLLHTDSSLSCVDLERPLLISNNRRLRIVARFCMLFRAKCNQNDSPRPTGCTFCVLRHNGEIIARDDSGTAMYAIRPVALLSIWGLRLS